uniref:Myb/SANT-like DNA-binding domain-containing protein n=1 Tax=Arundo donax TaxID=35708 RepID=A0A0A9DXA8_ARUDO
MQHPHRQQFHFAQQPVHQGVFAFPAANPMQDLGNVVKTSLSDEEDADDGHGKAAAAAASSQWHRVKWTSDMVKLLVSAVAYIDEDVDVDHGTSSGRKKHAMLKRKGKWKLVSSAMNERGFAVSPQQCEDKFNDLNKRYKRLTEILGRGTACQIVENPALLERVSLSVKLKEEAKKHLSSKHLHYEEMCSYHNRNRLCLLDDPVLQKSLRLALRSRDEHGKKSSFGFDDEDYQMLFSDDDEDDEFNDDIEVSAEDCHHRVHSTKKLKHDHEETHCGSHLSEVAAIDMNRMLSEGSGGPAAERNPSGMHSVQIEKQRLKIKAQMLKIEQRHFKWLRFSKEKDRELEKMKLENEKMALENERLELELKLKEIEMGIKPKRF